MIIETLERLNLKPLDIPGILVANHGVFAWGENIETAVKNAEAIEYIANLAFNTIAINPTTKPIDTYISDLHHERKHGLESYYGQE